MDNDETPAEAPPIPDESRVPADVRQVLGLLRDTALQLAAGFAQPPTRLRIRTGETSIEAEWGPADPACEASRTVPVGATPASLVPLAGAGTAAGGVAPGEGVEDDGTYLRSPTVGAFFRATQPGADPFVDVGDTVEVGQQIAIVETMKLMIPVVAETAGQIAEALKADGDAVEFGEPLFRLAPSTT